MARFVYRMPSFRAWFQKIRRGRGIVGAPPTIGVPGVIEFESQTLQVICFEAQII